MLRGYLKQDSHNIFHTFDDVAGAVRSLVEEVESAREGSANAASSVRNITASLVSPVII